GKDFVSNIERLYYGCEVCENLIPSVEEIKKAITIAQEKELDFTFVTPYVGPKGIEKLHVLFEYLNTLDDIEVVVNDIGVLHILEKKYQNLIPTLGRLLVKMKRDPRFTLTKYDIFEEAVKNPSKIIKNQEKVLQENSIDIEEYRDFLKNKGITRIGVDVTRQGINDKKFKAWGFPFDLYWPWTYITSGRNCNIAGHTQSAKAIHPTDESCFKQCKMYEFNFTSDKKTFQTVQRGTAVWMDSHTLYKDNFKKPFGRLIYQPYIPV
ncbi:hypothetical protein ACFLTE_02635, partial [Bacteroidota bacterium]